MSRLHVKPVILIVDYSPDDERQTTRALDRGFGRMELQVARDAETAATMLFAQGLQPDLIFLEIDLPRMSGIDLLKEIRNHPSLCTTPVMILSKRDDPETVRQAYAAGASGYLKKTYDPSQFMEKMYTITRYWFTSNVLPPKGEPSYVVMDAGIAI